MYIQSNANSSFLTRILEPVSTTYAPYKGGYVYVLRASMASCQNSCIEQMSSSFYIPHTRVCDY